MPEEDESWGRVTQNSFDDIVSFFKFLDFIS
jgi:hypothetical protein